ncbi:heterogeneous nuclear ribonucleoproteins C1/C2-like isoform X4 [Sciurus carolinensis]|uniref:heterogeneous nuclear ribonucleoproteins C1/C2-like isoform X4 n=1 Tax=Sciurus carolinensis TaxID=30640 RepID=UPI001FB24F42|nr:heterogeneous nuclear ribonucleoproteins C1/C2-like isoform X4 [Sciurus carolinensis]
MYEYQRIPPLISQVPSKMRRTHVGMEVKNRCSPHKVSRNNHLFPRQIKLGTEELHSIRGELSQIKAQVDSLLESLEHMDQQRDHPAGNSVQEQRTVKSTGALVVRAPHAELQSPSKSPAARRPIWRQTAPREAQTPSRQ